MSRLIYKLTPEQMAKIKGALASSKSALNMLRDDAIKKNENIMVAHWSEWLEENEEATDIAYYKVIPFLEPHKDTIEEELAKYPNGWEAV